MTQKKSEPTAITKSQTALEIQSEFYAKTMEIWKDEDAIHEMFAKDLSKTEFNYFVSLGVLFGANPFAGEIWAIKYDKDKPASIFLGRNFKRRKAQELKEYDGHYALAVYSGDTFKVVDGVPHHEYSNGDRGTLERAYCVVYKKGISRPFYKEVKFNEYNKSFSTWRGMPETMIVKVAENQGLDLAFQGVFQGTRDESEQWGKEKNPENINVDPEMEIVDEKVRDHDDTGFGEKGSPEKTPLIEDKTGNQLKTETPSEIAENDAKNLEESENEKAVEEISEATGVDLKEKKSDNPKDGDAPPISEKEKRTRKFNVANLLRTKVGNSPKKQQDWLEAKCYELFQISDVRSWADVDQDWLDQLEKVISKIADPGK